MNEYLKLAAEVVGALVASAVYLFVVSFVTLSIAIYLLGTAPGLESWLAFVLAMCVVWTGISLITRAVDAAREYLETSK